MSYQSGHSNRTLLSCDCNLLPHNGNLPPSTILCYFYWNETNGALAVRLRPTGRPYSSFMACSKTVQFILWTVSRTYGQLRVLFRRQHRRHLRRNFLCISYVLQLYFLCIFFVFYGFIKAIMEAVYRWFYFLSTASV